MPIEQAQTQTELGFARVNLSLAVRGKVGGWERRQSVVANRNCGARVAERSGGLDFDVPVPRCPICLIYQGYKFPLFNATKVRKSKLILTLSLSLSPFDN